MHLGVIQDRRVIMQPLPSPTRIHHLAAHLGMSVATLRRWAAQGCPSTRVNSRRHEMSAADLAAWLRVHRSFMAEANLSAETRRRLAELVEMQ